MKALNGVRTFFIALGLMLPSMAMAAPFQNIGITASLSPANPTVGVSKVSITGRASTEKKVTDTSTFPDGSVHKFSVNASATGSYTDGPFVLQQLGTYHDVVRDDAAGASTTISYRGVGDFSVTVDHASRTIRAGEETSFTITFTSVSGFGGKIALAALNLSQVVGAIASWSAPLVRVPSNGSAAATLTILTLVSTPAGAYKIALQGTNGSVAHAIPISLRVAAPAPSTITAEFSPANAVVGVTEVSIRGTASAGEGVTDTSTFPDGSIHKFTVNASGAGVYTDGPFVLQELGTYHDVLRDDATGATTTFSYRGLGNFSMTVDHGRQTVARGEAASFMVTFKSGSGFGGTIAPSPPNLSRVLGATASWSAPSVTVRPGDSASSRLSIKTSASTPAGSYKITVQGTNGSVTRAVLSDISLTVR